MTPGLRGKIAIAVAVVLALLCYATIAYRAVGGGIYEVAAAHTTYLDLIDATPAATQSELSRLASHGGR